MSKIEELGMATYISSKAYPRSTFGQNGRWALAHYAFKVDSWLSVGRLLERSDGLHPDAKPMAKVTLLEKIMAPAVGFLL
ncbi:hypothetical protein [Pseudomonas syringae]|uniref:hypothetical protein n=1 Tax=Pseudomonas syringae TaxID=317 RepID=UPI00129366CE|nr:hypothetical protein [Pseudomonas syringae]